MQGKGKNLGRAYLIGKLRERGLSRRGAKQVLDFVLEEMKAALARDEPVEFPLGWLMREKKISPHWELIGDEPMKPYTVEHYTDIEGFERIAELDGLDFGTHGWSILLPKQETPPYEKPRRPRGRPRKATAPAKEPARSGRDRTRRKPSR